MTTRLLHKAHQVAEHTALAWSNDREQAKIRAAQIVTSLARFGLLKDVGGIHDTENWVYADEGPR